MLVAIHERRESVQKFWKRTTKRPIREDGTHDALFASKSPRETKTKASLAWKARICDASSPFPTVAFGVARARARAVEKIEKNDQGRSRRRKTKETFQTAFLKSAPLPHSRRCRNSPRSSLLRPARSRRNRRPRTRCRRPNRTRFLLLLLLLLLSHSFFLFFFCALRSAVVVSLSQVRPFSSSFRSLFFWPISGFTKSIRLFCGAIFETALAQKKQRKREFLSTLFHSFLGKNTVVAKWGATKKNTRTRRRVLFSFSPPSTRSPFVMSRKTTRSKEEEAV